MASVLCFFSLYSYRSSRSSKGKKERQLWESNKENGRWTNIMLKTNSKHKKRQKGLQLSISCKIVKFLIGNNREKFTNVLSICNTKIHYAFLGHQYYIRGFIPYDDTCLQLLIRTRPRTLYTRLSENVANDLNFFWLLALQWIEQKGMTFDQDFGFYFPPFLFPSKKEGRRKGEWSSKNHDQKSCLSTRSLQWALISSIWSDWFIQTFLDFHFEWLKKGF